MQVRHLLGLGQSQSGLHAQPALAGERVGLVERLRDLTAHERLPLPLPMPRRRRDLEHARPLLLGAPGRRGAVGGAPLARTRGPPSLGACRALAVGGALVHEADLQIHPCGHIRSD